MRGYARSSRGFLHGEMTEVAHAAHFSTPIFRLACGLLPAGLPSWRRDIAASRRRPWIASIGSSMNRVIQGVLAALLTGFGAWLAWRNLSMSAQDGWIFWVPITLWLLTMGLLCWWSVLSGDGVPSRSRIRASWQGGWMVGGIGLAAGLVGPVVLQPEANLGPLLGVLMTGPLGFVVGALGMALFLSGRGSASSFP